jgi:hypothetical protein
MKLTITIMVLIFIVSIVATAAEKPAIEERLIRLEEGQKMLLQRVEDTNKRIEDTNKRIDDLRQDMNQRFDDMNRRFDERFDDLHFWLQIVLGLLALVIAGFVAQFLLLWQRLVRVESKVEDHLAETEKDRLIIFQREEIEMLKARLDKLEAQ